MPTNENRSSEAEPMRPRPKGSQDDRANLDGPFLRKLGESPFLKGAQATFLGVTGLTFDLRAVPRMSREIPSAPRTIPVGAALARIEAPVQVSGVPVAILVSCAARIRPSRHLPKSRSHKDSPSINRTTWDSISRLLGLLADYLALRLQEDGMSDEPPASPAIREAKEYIKRHSSEAIRLAKVARLVNISPTHFSEKFKAETGENFVDHVSRIRVERTKKLLHGTDRPITEIAFQVGFQSLSQFNRTFKKIVGATPRDFRKDAGAG